MSVVNLCEKAARLALKEAVRQKNFGIAHPAQTFVALRQSVGTLRKLPRWPHRMLLHSWFTFHWRF